MANGFTIPTNLVLNLGKYPNDGTGDDLYTAFTKIKNTLNLINSELGVSSAENIGTSGEGLFAGKVDNNLQFKKITGSNGVTITSTDTNINISALSDVQGDTNPHLGGDLYLNTHNVYGPGDIRTTVFGINVSDLSDQVQTLLSAPNFADTDLGTFTNPGSGNYDLGYF
jgi:hypothetical protein